MPCRLALSLLHININSMDIQGNPLLNITGNGGTYISQANDSDRVQATPTSRTSGQNTYFHPFSTHFTDRCVETQARIRRKLDEACRRPGAVYGIDVVAQVATDILAVIEVYIHSISRSLVPSEPLKYLTTHPHSGKSPFRIQYFSSKPCHECACYCVYCLDILLIRF